MLAGTPFLRLGIGAAGANGIRRPLPLGRSETVAVKRTGGAGGRKAAGSKVTGRKVTGRKVTRRRLVWTEARRELFLAELAASCNVTAACTAADVSSGSAYREREANGAFRAGWDRALTEGYERLELAMLRRAMDGTVKEVRRADGSIDRVVDYSDRVGLQLLKQHKDRVAEAGAAAEESEEEAAASVERIMRRLDGVRRRLGLEDDGDEEGEGAII